jgi:hypothetical protein
MTKRPKLVEIDDLRVPPFETNELRRGLREFYDSVHTDESGGAKPVGDYRWGVYAFFDYDGEPIYVGQTNEKLRSRIGRHLTNQRTDAVAMSVLDPFEVFEIQVWPLVQFENVTKKRSPAAFAAAAAYLNALEYLIFTRLRDQSTFKAILNEKDPPVPTVAITEPRSKRSRIVSDKVQELRCHPDVRIARRTLVVSRLAQSISERKVGVGLRRVLLTQAKRLEWLAQRRFDGLGGEQAVEVGPEDEEDSTED